MTQAADKKIWLPAKRYGWGWGVPICWQGWAVMGGYLSGLMILVMLGTILFAGNRPPAGNGWVMSRWHGLATWSRHSGGRTDLCLQISWLPSFSPVLGTAVWGVLLFFLTGGLFAICWRKGERPRWRWGK